MVSKVENAQTSPSLATLTRLAKAIEVPLTSFFRGFEEERDVSYVRAGEGIEIRRTGVRRGHRYELLAAAQGVGRIVRPFLVTLTEPGGPYPMSQHIESSSFTSLMA
jgi:transcriptional regulator with XRE-family HTH domain